MATCAVVMTAAYFRPWLQPVIGLLPDFVRSAASTNSPLAVQYLPTKTRQISHVIVYRTVTTTTVLRDANPLAAVSWPLVVFLLLAALALACTSLRYHSAAKQLAGELVARTTAQAENVSLRKQTARDRSSILRMRKAQKLNGGTFDELTGIAKRQGAKVRLLDNTIAQGNGILTEMWQQLIRGNKQLARCQAQFEAEIRSREAASEEVEGQLEAQSDIIAELGRRLQAQLNITESGGSTIAQLTSDLKYERMPETKVKKARAGKTHANQPDKALGQLGMWKSNYGLDYGRIIADTYRGDDMQKDSRGQLLSGANGTPSDDPAERYPRDRIPDSAMSNFNFVPGHNLIESFEEVGQRWVKKDKDERDPEKGWEEIRLDYGSTCAEGSWDGKCFEQTQELFSDSSSDVPIVRFPSAQTIMKARNMENATVPCAQRWSRNGSRLAKESEE